MRLSIAEVKRFVVVANNVPDTCREHFIGVVARKARSEFLALEGRESLNNCLRYFEDIESMPYDNYLDEEL